MDIILSNVDGTPIYEQIARQIKAKIVGGELQPGEALPSMRLLELLREEQLRRVETHLEEAAKAAHLGNLEKDEFLEIAAAVFEEGI